MAAPGVFVAPVALTTPGGGHQMKIAGIAAAFAAIAIQNTKLDRRLPTLGRSCRS
jgi:hypothetical protein